MTVALSASARIAPSARQLRQGPTQAKTARAAVTVRATAERNTQVEIASSSRREVVFQAAAAFAAVAAVSTPQPASAFLGFGEDKNKLYTDDTSAVIEQVRTTIQLPMGDEGRAASIEKTRTMTNQWVAKYRRNKGISGKPSYGNVYSALNAVSGHFNNFGTKYPLPAKRLERTLKEFSDAELALSRGR